MNRKRRTVPRINSRAPTEVDKQVGRNIRQYRQDLHMTLNELAARLGVSQQQIQKYETGDSRVSASMILAIADVLEIGIEDLFVGTRDQKRSKKCPLETARRECHMWIDKADSEEALAQMARVLKALAKLVGTTTPIKGVYQDSEVFEDEAYLRFAGVKGTTDIVVDIEAASAEVEVSRANLTSILHDLHRGKDAGPFWKRLIDVTAILIIAMSLAGLILFLSLRFRLATSLKIMGATLGVRRNGPMIAAP